VARSDCLVGCKLHAPVDCSRGRFVASRYSACPTTWLRALSDHHPWRSGEHEMKGSRRTIAASTPRREVIQLAVNAANAIGDGLDGATSNGQRPARADEVHRQPKQRSRCRGPVAWRASLTSKHESPKSRVYAGKTIPRAADTPLRLFDLWVGGRAGHERLRRAPRRSAGGDSGWLETVAC